MRDAICPHCGKKFLLKSGHKYKLIKNGKIMSYCGYNCWIANDTRKYNFQKGKYGR